jgi:hypothetical protein
MIPLSVAVAVQVLTRAVEFMVKVKEKFPAGPQLALIFVML